MAAQPPLDVVDDIIHRQSGSTHGNPFKGINPLKEYKALVFDCYGTLIDWERGMFNALQPIFEQKTCPDGRLVFETMGQCETRLQQENQTMMYPTVLEKAYKELTGLLRLHCDPEDAIEFGLSVGSWPAFPDSAGALARLRALGLKLIVLSNVDNRSFEMTRKRLETDGTEFDAVYTAEDIGSYKPDLRNFGCALERLQLDFEIEPQEVLSVANSLYHDVAPAHKIGIRAAWINREGNIMGVEGHESGMKPDYEFATMDDFATAMELAYQEA